MPSTTDPIYQVKLYQINASQDGGGDCAIILLLDTAQNKVLWAALIDGGNGPKTADIALRAVQDLEKMYKFEGDNFLFDVVSISHWDADHWYGFARQYAEDSAMKNFLYNPRKGFKDTGSSENAQHTLFKYEGTKSKASKPLTRFYCQNWGNGTLTASTAGINKDSTAAQTPTGKQGICPINVKLMGSGKSSSNPKKWVLDGRTSTTSVLGVNLINGEGLKDSNGNGPECSAILTVKDLVQYNHPWILSRKDNTYRVGCPGLYVWGVNALGLGNKTEYGVFDYTKSKPTPSNKGSIMLLLIWVKVDPNILRATQMANPRLEDITISFYSGGDAEFMAENALTAWLTTYTKAQKIIQVVKAGHHGSSAGTSQPFIKSVKPDLFLISNGTGYTHPLPEVVWFMHAFFKGSPSSNPLFTKRMWLLCWPYWLGRVQPATGNQRWMMPPHSADAMDPEVFNANHKNESPITPAEQVWQDLRKEMSDWYNLQGVPDQVAEFTAELGQIDNNDTDFPGVDSKAIAKKQALSGRIATLLNDVSAITGMYYPKSSTLSTGVAAEDKSMKRLVLIMHYIEVTFGSDGKCLSIDSKPLNDLVAYNKVPKIELILSSDKPKGNSSPQVLGPKRKRTPACDFSASGTGVFVMSDTEEANIWKNDGTSWSQDAPGPNLQSKNQIVQRPFASLPPNTLTSNTPFNIVAMELYPDDTNTAAALKNSNLWYCLAGLHNQYITLDTTLIDPKSVLWQYSLVKSDEFATWIYNVFYLKAATVASANIQAWHQAEGVGFCVKVTDFCGSHWTLEWNSQNSITQFVLGSGKYNDRQKLTAAIDSSGFITDSKILIMGLDIRQSARSNTQSLEEKFNLSDILAFIGFDGIPAALSGSKIQLDLDFPIVTDLKTQQDFVNDDAVQALFFVPGDLYNTTLRIDFKERHKENETSALSKFLEDAFPNLIFDTVKIKAIRRSQMSYIPSDSPSNKPNIQILSSGELYLKTTMHISTTPKDIWDTYIVFDQDRLSLIARFASTKNPLSSFMTWISTKMQDLEGIWKGYGSILSSWSGDDNVTSLREIRLEVQWVARSPTITFVSMTLQLNSSWGVDPSANTVVPYQLVFSYRNQGGLASYDFTGSIWPTTATGSDSVLNVLDPTSPIYPLLQPGTPPAGKAYVYSLDLKQTGSSQDMVRLLPKGIPTQLTNLVLDISTNSLGLSAVIQANTPTTETALSTPNLSLDAVELNAGLSWASKTQTLNLGFLAAITLIGPSGIDIQPASLDVQMEYVTSEANASSSQWTLSGSVFNLSGAHLYPLFPAGDRDGIMSVLRDIAISQLSIEYNYSSDGIGSSFTATGNLELDVVTLAITFKVPGDDPNEAWSFSANMDWVSQPDIIYTESNTTLQSIVSSICSDIDLPDFLDDISLSVGIKSTLDFQCSKNTDSNRILVFLDATIALDTDGIDAQAQFSFVQLSPDLSTQNLNLATADPTRILKFEVNALPSLPGIPMLSNFEQPFDQLGFLWCSTDLTRAIVDNLNTALFKNDSHSELVYRDPRKYTSSTAVLDPSNQENDKVILAGSHLFIVVEEDNIPTAIVDYQFNTTSQSNPLPTNPTAAPNNGTVQDGASGVLQVSKGPLVVGGVTLKFQTPNLQITFDATVKFGGLEATLNGFGVKFNLASVFQLDLSSVTLLIDGLGLGMNDPPVSLSGEVIKKGSDFFGGVSLGIEPYNFMGGGFYGSATASDTKSTFDTIFVFAAVDGPFVELEFASLSGLTAGFGHNSHMTLPTVDNVTTFPFLTIGSESSAPNPLAVLNSFTQPTASQPVPWFSNIGGEGELWMAAGMKVTAFNNLVVDAVLTVDLTASDIVIGLFADAVATVPAQEPDQTKLFAMVEMGLLALLDWSKGIFKVEGQLTPRSFILCSDCKLKGGFALCYFFSGSGHEGDWVFSIGGYHPAFVPPSWYPVPQRVGITWVLDSSITISGEAYFAVTPKCCMGGGKLDLVFSDGNLHAWFDVYADFLINYSPFSFRADLGVNIGISYDLTIAFITHHFQINFGCSLHLHGPPVAGYVHVGWSILSFDIHFGNANEPTAKLDWLQFQDLIRQDGTTASNTGLNIPPYLVKLTATKGLVSSPNAVPESQMTTLAADYNTNTPTPPWTVDHATFAFDFTSMFPITSFRFNDTYLNLPTTIVDGFGISQPLDSVSMKPMGATKNASSFIHVTVQSTAAFAVEQAFVPTLIVKNVPTGIWDSYNPLDDPYYSTSVPTSAYSSAGSTKPLITGVSFSLPPPTERGPNLVMDTVNQLSYDCYRNTNTPPAKLPIDNTGEQPLQSSDDHSSLAPVPATYQNPTEQDQAFEAAASAWQKSASADLAAVLAGLANALGVPPKSRQAQKMNAFATRCGPPMVLIENMKTSFVVPPLLSKGTG